MSLISPANIISGTCQITKIRHCKGGRTETVTYKLKVDSKIYTVVRARRFVRSKHAHCPARSYPLVNATVKANLAASENIDSKLRSKDSSIYYDFIRKTDITPKPAAAPAARPVAPVAAPAARPIVPVITPQQHLATINALTVQVNRLKADVVRLEKALEVEKSERQRILGELSVTQNSLNELLAILRPLLV